MNNEEKILQMLTQLTTIVTGIETKITGLESTTDFISVEVQSLKQNQEKFSNKLDKNTLILENMDTKVKTIAEIQENHMSMLQKQHTEVLANIEEKNDLLKLVIVKNLAITNEKMDNVSKDIKFVKHKIYKTEEEVFDIKDHLQIVK